MKFSILDPASHLPAHLSREELVKLREEFSQTKTLVLGLIVSLPRQVQPSLSVDPTRRAFVLTFPTNGAEIGFMEMLRNLDDTSDLAKSAQSMNGLRIVSFVEGRAKAYTLHTPILA